MLYVSVRWSRLHGLNFSRSVGVIGRIQDILISANAGFSMDN